MGRLAAVSVAAIAGSQPPRTEDENAEEDRASSAEGDSPGDDVAVSEFCLFKQQIRGDFRTVRNDVSTAFKFVIPGSRQRDKVAIPNFISSVAGAGVAACLLPVRA